MRDILFKAKRIDNGEWVQGNLFIEGNRVEITRGTCNGIGIEGIAVDPNTICQFTGLTDKNGNKIWENDIVEVYIRGYHTICTVSWAEAVAHFQLWQINTIPNTPTALNLGNYDCEVLGNIFDNADLLKGE